MCAAMHPANVSAGVDRGGAGELGGVAQFGCTPVLTETSGAILGAPALQIGIAEQPEQVELVETHGLVRSLIGIGQTSAGLTEPRAELGCFGWRSDHDETHRDPGAFEIVFELAQLRERFTKERSTDVPQPDHECRKRHSELQDGFGCSHDPFDLLL